MSISDLFQTIQLQQNNFLSTITKWSNINSFSYHLEGLEKMASSIYSYSKELGFNPQFVDLKPNKFLDISGNYIEKKIGPIIHIENHQKGKLNILLSIHYDTVFPETSNFHCSQENNFLKGPGVLDAKSGIIIILQAIAAFSKLNNKDQIGWDIVINPDEELGSPVSVNFLKKIALRNDLALVYEPSLPDGTLINQRKGSGNFVIVVHGKKAHAGREHHLGVNAIDYLAHIMIELEELNNKKEGMTINLGKIQGGGPVNVVPDLAACTFNIRMKSLEDMEFCNKYILNIVEKYNKIPNLSVIFDGKFLAPPKPLTEKTKRLCNLINNCSLDLGVPIRWASTGGVCDGNRIASTGIPVIDTMGGLGGGMHSENEYLEIDSVAHKIMLTILLLIRLSENNIHFKTSRT